MRTLLLKDVRKGMIFTERDGGYYAEMQALEDAHENTDSRGPGMACKAQVLMLNGERASTADVVDYFQCHGDCGQYRLDLETTEPALLDAVELTKLVLSVAMSLDSEPSWRIGQALFNTLYHINPALARCVTGPAAADPFYVDKNIPAFFKRITSPELVAKHVPDCWLDGSAARIKKGRRRERHGR